MQKSGSFFSYGELRLGQGRNNTKQYLADNPETFQEIEAKLFEALGIERDAAARSRPRSPIAEASAEQPEREAA